MSASILGQQLAAGGHLVRRCRFCGREFAADLDHAGRPHAPQRLYCEPACREAAGGRRKGVRARVVRAHRRQFAGLIERHALEAAGQTAIGGPLPPVPDLEAAS